MEFQTVHRKYLTLLRLRALAAVSAAAFIGGITVEFFSLPWLIGTGSCLLLFLLFCFVYAPLEYRRHRYLAAPDRIGAKSGLFISKTRFVYLRSVKHFVIFATPFARMLGLKTVILYVAGSSVTLSGLTNEQAEKIVDHVLKVSGIGGK